MTKHAHPITVTAKLLEPIFQLAKHFPSASDQNLEAHFLSIAELSANEFNKPGSRFSENRLPILLDELSSISENPTISVNLGEVTQPQSLGSIGFLMSTAASLELATQALVDYLPLLHEGAALQFEKNQHQFELVFELNQTHNNTIIFFLSCLVNWPRMLTGQQVPALSVHLTQPPPDDSQVFQQHFAAEVEFSAPQNKVIFSQKYFNLPCLDANPEMHQLHREFADTLMGIIGAENALTARTRNLIRQHITQHNGAIRREQIALTLGLSLRSLQRKLGKLGSSFQEIYDQTRKEICLQLIHKSQHSFGEIAYQLGFSNQSAFQKAFKRWMDTTPSEYRKSVKPELLTPPSLSDNNTKTLWLEEPKAEALLADKTKELSLFCTNLLEWASVYGRTFSLNEIAALTDNPIARLAIHIWPPEQSGLIAQLSNENENAVYEFVSDLVWQHYYTAQTIEQREQRHYLLAKQLLSQTEKLSTIDSYLILFKQVEKSGALFTKDESLFLLKAANNASRLAEQQRDYSSAAYFQTFAINLPEYKNEAAKAVRILRYAELLFLAGNIAKAQEQLDGAGLTNPHAAVLQSRIFQHQGDIKAALNCLLAHLDSANLSLPKTAPEQLSEVVRHVELINKHLTFSQSNELTIAPKGHAEDYHHVLEQICLLARQLSQPLLAAVAISQMTQHTITVGATSHSAFAFASFAWVASWFISDRELAKKSAHQSRMILLSMPFQQALLDKSAARQQDPSLILCSQVEHWYRPIEYVIANLDELEKSCTDRGLYLELIDVETLSFQMKILRSREHTLPALMSQLEAAEKRIKQQGATKQVNSLIDSATHLIHYLTETPLTKTSAHYDNAWQATSLLMAAFLLDEQKLWPDLIEWQNQIENELPGYFASSETQFLTAMMRINIALSQGAFTRKKALDFSRILSRFEIWANHCPENYAVQLMILRAEFSRLEGTSPTALFEEAIQLQEKGAFSYLLPLTYTRYADYLQHKHQTRLADFCYQKAAELYDKWGAFKVAKTVESKRAILAQ